MSDRTIVIDSADGNYLSSNMGDFKIRVCDSRDSRFPRNRRIGLQAINGQWLCSEPDQNGAVTATQSARGSSGTFELRELGGNHAALRASTGKFVTAKPDGSQLLADSLTVGPDQIFTLKHLPGGQVNLQCSNGLFVCANNGGGDGIVNNRAEARGWETFALTTLPLQPVADRQVALRTYDGTHVVCAEGGGDLALNAMRTIPDGWETFTLRDLGHGRVALLACNGKFVRVDSDGAQLLADQTSLGPMSVFCLQSIGDGRYALLGGNGRYVCAEGGGNDILTCRSAVIRGWESFTVLFFFAPVDGSVITLKGDNGLYLSRYYAASGAHEICSCKSEIDIYSMFTVAVRNDKIALRADNGQWVSRISYGSYDTIEARKSEIDQYCLFSIVRQGSVIALKADNNHFVGRSDQSLGRMQADKSRLDAACLLAVNV